MIPKIIHFCWFGGNPKTPLIIKCIESWKKHLSDYTFIEWNETNFDLTLFPFAQQAYENKKYAFVSDVCRIFALKTYGGIYLDTDVEVVKSFNDLLNNKAFTGFEDEKFIQTGVLGSEKNGSWINDVLEYYKERSFIIDNNKFDLTPNPKIITSLLETRGLQLNNTNQEIKDYITVFTADYFCPKNYNDNVLHITKNTFAIHHFASSWLPLHKRILHRIKIFLKYHQLKKIIHKTF